MLLKLFPFLSLLFDADTGGAGGATDTGAGDPPGGTPQSPPAVGGAPTGGAAAAPGGATFTQADLDRIAGQTRKEAIVKWAKEHGFAGVKEAEDAIKAQREAQDQAKTDLEKAQAAAASEKAAREATEARLYNSILRSAFDRAAVEKVADLDLAYLAAKDAGLLNGDGGIVVDAEAGKVTGLDSVVETLLKNKPILKKISTATPAGTAGADGGNTSTATTPEQEDATRRTYGIRRKRA